MISALFALMLIVQEPVQASAAQATEVQKLKKEKKICRSDDQQTGTRMRKRTCLTRAQWELRDQAKNGEASKGVGDR